MQPDPIKLARPVEVVEARVVRSDFNSPAVLRYSQSAYSVRPPQSPEARLAVERALRGMGSTTSRLLISQRVAVQVAVATTPELVESVASAERVRLVEVVAQELQQAEQVERVARVS